MLTCPSCIETREAPYPGQRLSLPLPPLPGRDEAWSRLSYLAVSNFGIVVETPRNRFRKRSASVFDGLWAPPRAFLAWFHLVWGRFGPQIDDCPPDSSMFWGPFQLSRALGMGFCYPFPQTPAGTKLGGSAIYGCGYNSCGCNLRLSEVCGVDLEPAWDPKCPKPDLGQP